MIRSAGPGDLAALAAIERVAFGAAGWSEAMLAPLLADPASVLLCRGQPPVGFAALRVAADEAELLRIAVCPDQRRRGLGRTLLDGVLRWAAARGAVRVFLELEAGNGPALRLYEAGGFAAVGVRRGYYPSGGDALLLARDLQPSTAGPKA